MSQEEFVGRGWWPLVRPLLAYAERHGFHVVQVKEKFGGLRFYYDAPGGVAKEANDYFRECVHGAEQLSLIVCEVCGEPGMLKSSHGWMLTRCDKCMLPGDSVTESNNSL